MQHIYVGGGMSVETSQRTTVSLTFATITANINLFIQSEPKYYKLLKF